MKLLFLLLVFSVTSVLACEFERETQPFVRVGAGWTGNFNGDRLANEGELAAMLELGVRFPLNKNWLLDAKYSHNSWWFTHEDSDEARDHINFGVEYRL